MKKASSRVLRGNDRYLIKIFNRGFLKEASSIKKSMVRNRIRNTERLDKPQSEQRQNPLNNPLDLTLLIVSILLVVALIVVVSWFCYQKRKDQNRIQELKVTANTQNYPEITIIRSKMMGSDAEDSTDTKGDSCSVVSSIWDTVSQKFDKTYMEDKEMQARRIEDIHQQLKSNSMDILGIGKVRNHQDDDLSVSTRDYNIRDQDDCLSVSSRDYNIGDSASI